MPGTWTRSQELASGANKPSLTIRIAAPASINVVGEHLGADAINTTSDISSVRPVLNNGDKADFLKRDGGRELRGIARSSVSNE